MCSDIIEVILGSIVNFKIYKYLYRNKQNRYKNEAPFFRFINVQIYNYYIIFFKQLKLNTF